MLEALQSSLSNVLVLILVSACGWWAARRGTFGEKERAAAAKIVTFTLPFYLFLNFSVSFHSITVNRTGLIITA